MSKINLLKTNRGCTPHLFAVLIIIITLLILAKFTFRGLTKISPNFLNVPTELPEKLSPTPKFRKINLYINPATISAKVNQELNLSIDVRNLGTDVTAIDSTINYDNNFLVINKASPSSFFVDQTIFSNTVDNDEGKVRISIGSLIPSTKSGTLITISARILPVASGSSNISFSKNTRVAAENTVESVLGTAKGAMIKITNQDF